MINSEKTLKNYEKTEKEHKLGGSLDIYRNKQIK